MNSSQNQYLLQVEQWFTDCPIQTKIKLLSGLKEEIDEFISQMPDSRYEDLVELFGEPGEAAQKLLDAVPLEERQAAQWRKSIKNIILFAILSAAVIVLFYQLVISSKNHVVIETYISKPHEISDEEFRQFIEGGP